MRVLVTGSTGFVGSHVCRLLVDRQHTVFGLCRDSSARLPQGCTTVCGDLEDVASLDAALRESAFDVVINVAGVYAWWLADASLFDRVNVAGVRNLIEALRKHPGAALVQVSTVLAYGRCCAPQEVFAEETPPGPHASAYAASKHRGDAIAQEAFASGTVRGSTLFLACCIGADPKLVDAERDVMRMLDLVEGSVPATIAGEVVFTYVSVRDAAEAIVRAAARARSDRGDRWLIGDQRLSTRTFYALIAELSGQPAPAFEIPAWVARLSARTMTAWANLVSGRPPTAPTDLVRTAVSGTLCFDAGKSKRELGMEYTPIRVAFAEAIDLITDTTTRTGEDERDGAMIAAEQRGRLVEEGERGGDGG